MSVKQWNTEIGEQAKEKDLRPYLLKSLAELKDMPPYPFPNLGYYADTFDEKYETLETFFVDKSGWGREDEPALTQREFHEVLTALLEQHEKTGILVAIVEEGSFQIYIRAWKPDQ